MGEKTSLNESENNLEEPLISKTESQVEMEENAEAKGCCDDIGAGVFSFCKVAIIVIMICVTWTQTGEDRQLQFGLIHELIAKHNIQIAWHYDDFMQ